ncbi:hypothetical protein, partial [Pseudomonas syringae]|uniref:hypothetical protein n=1 Tax=Pseudomonas syringae TaxID=317 RepID=UPI001E46EA7D
ESWKAAQKHENSAQKLAQGTRKKLTTSGTLIAKSADNTDLRDTWHVTCYSDASISKPIRL